jgi:hypothetical protein
VDNVWFFFFALFSSVFPTLHTILCAPFEQDSKVGKLWVTRVGKPGLTEKFKFPKKKKKNLDNTHMPWINLISKKMKHMKTKQTRHPYIKCIASIFFFYVMLNELNASYSIFVFQYNFINAIENRPHRWEDREASFSLYLSISFIESFFYILNLIALRHYKRHCQV